MALIDSDSLNPPFCGDMNRICKKERGFMTVYLDHLVPFMMSCGNIDFEHGQGYGTLVSRCEWVSSPSHQREPVDRSQGACVYCFLKFRSKFAKNKGFSGGPRITLAIGPIGPDGERNLIPLEIYTHQMRSDDRATNTSELKERLKRILERIKAQRENI